MNWTAGWLLLLLEEVLPAQSNGHSFNVLQACLGEVKTPHWSCQDSEGLDKNSSIEMVCPCHQVVNTITWLYPPKTKENYPLTIGQDAISCCQVASSPSSLSPLAFIVLCCDSSSTCFLTVKTLKCLSHSTCQTKWTQCFNGWVALWMS